IQSLPAGFHLIARTESIPVAAFRANESFAPQPVYGIQFHPEVTHSTDGRQLLKNYIIDIRDCKPYWTPAAIVEDTVSTITNQVTYKMSPSSVSEPFILMSLNRSPYMGPL